jgi:oligopeptidase B
VNTRLLLIAALTACCPPDAAVVTAPKPIAPRPVDPVKPVEAPRPTGPVAPVAKRVPHDVVSPHGTRDDPYYWLRDDTRTNKEVLAYLEAENAYTRAILEPVKKLEDTLFDELKARIKEDDSSVPLFDDGYWYYSRFEAGKQYPIYARKKAKLTEPEQILLDGNELAKGHAYYSIADYAVSRDNRYLAYAEDTVGRRQYVLRLKDLKTGALLPDTATDIAGTVEFSNDSKHVFFGGRDAKTTREDKVLRHTIGGKTELVYEEKDESYYVNLAHTKSRKYLVVEMSATTNSELRLIDADKPLSAPRVFFPRSPDHEYNVDHLDGRFVIHTNWNAKNFRVMEVAEGKEGNRDNWKELIAHRPDVLVEDVVVARNFIAMSIFQGGLRKVEVAPPKTDRAPRFVIDAPDPAYSMFVIDLPDATTRRVRYSYNSMTRPGSVYELDVTTKQRELLKQQPVPTYDPEQYASEYQMATAPDGVKVPVSIVYKKTTKRDGTAPLAVYGYGAYGASMPPAYSPSVTSLLDRGWVYAIAHVRGGSELGRTWYEDGKLMKKKNTFTDFIAVSEFLAANKYGDRKRIYASGGSAGGLLMGAILNMRPDLYRGVAAIVPFVDAVTTMLDTSIPLTTNEFDEWGNPGADKAAYDYILSYSPYDNVAAKAYPAIYCKTGLHDSQVMYFEPAKWIAKLRATAKPGLPIVLDTDMTSGHGGASGRFDRLRETARMYAFFLMVDSSPDPRAAAN